MIQMASGAAVAIQSCPEASK